MDEAADEPSDFEWRNLKKLAVLVLSSLVWKNTLVQNQIRPLGGIEAVLNCCSYDEHNPYIREHAIMCLRFLMEGNRDNQERIRALEQYSQARDGPRGATPVEVSLRRKMEEGAAAVNVRVPDEVLDQQGYETYMDGKGQVMLRKRQGGAQGAGLGLQQPLPAFSAGGAGGAGGASAASAASAVGGASGASGISGSNPPPTPGQPAASLPPASPPPTSSAAPHTPKALDQLVQQVMRELPSSAAAAGGRAGEERADGEALMKLDRGFDGGGGSG